MKKEYDQELVSLCPNLYRDRYASMQETCMCWGFDVNGNGWYSLIKELSIKLEALIVQFIKDNPNLNCRNCGDEKEDHYGSLTPNPGKCLAIHEVFEYKKPTIFQGILAFFGFGKKKKLHSCWCEKYSSIAPCASQVKEKYGCYDDQTEILTISGWKYFKDLNSNDKVILVKCIV